MNTSSEGKTLKNQRGFTTTMKMTKKIALNVALSNCGADNYVYENETVSGEEVREALTKMIEQLSKPRSEGSEEAREKAAAKRKEANAKVRAELLEQVTPVLRANLSEPVTAKELYELCKTDLPDDFSWNKVQHILIHEMKPELEITERKKGGNTYQIKK